MIAVYLRKDGKLRRVGHIFWIKMSIGHCREWIRANAPYPGRWSKLHRGYGFKIVDGREYVFKFDRSLRHEQTKHDDQVEVKTL